MSRPSYHVRAMARDALNQMRCRRCGMHRLDDSPFCRACDADLSLPNALEPVGPGLAGAATGRALSPQASRSVAEAGSQTPPSAPVVGAPSVGSADAGGGDRRRAPAEPVAPGRTAPASRLWAALDPRSRRTMLRLGVELVILAVVVAAVAVNTIGRSRPAATGAPSAALGGAVVTVPGIGITAADITTVFELPYAGGFVFSPAGTGADARLEGTSADGLVTIALYGPRADVTRAVLTIHVAEDHKVDVAARQLMAVFLILYCPAAADQLQATLADAIATGRDLAVGASGDGIEARLQTHLQPGGTVTVTLVAAGAPTATPAATSSPTRSLAPSTAPSSTARPSGTPTPAGSQPRSAAPAAPSPTPKVTPKAS